MTPFQGYPSYRVGRSNVSFFYPPPFLFRWLACLRQKKEEREISEHRRFQSAQVRGSNAIHRDRGGCSILFIFILTCFSPLIREHKRPRRLEKSNCEPTISIDYFLTILLVTSIEFFLFLSLFRIYQDKGKRGKGETNEFFDNYSESYVKL